MPRAQSYTTLSVLDAASAPISTAFMTRRFPACLVGVHLLYAVILPSRGAKAVALAGVIVSAAWWLASLSRRCAALIEHELALVDSRRAAIAAAAFALPLISLAFQPAIAFVRIDGRALLIVAWLVALWTIIGAPHAAPAPPRLRSRWVTHLFVFWSAAFWLMLIWDVGVGRAVQALTRDDRLTISFRIWETQPAREHLFLIWLSDQAFASREAYTNHLHPAAFLFYACSKGVQLVTGLPPYVGRNLWPFLVALVGVVAFAALLPGRPRDARDSLKFHALLFLALGFVLSEWHFWVYPLTYNFDTIFPLIAYLTVIVWACGRPRVSRRNSTRLGWSLVLFALFGWLYTPLLVLAAWVLLAPAPAAGSSGSASRRAFVRWSIAATIVTVAAYALPVVLVAMKGYDSTSSSWLFRSGLDGDTRYFRNVVQAVVHPFANVRSWWSLLLPSCVPLALAGAQLARRRSGRGRLWREAMFLLSPYLWSLALFPQAVSIHPYLYDMLLIVPVALMGATWMLERRVYRSLEGATLLAAVLVAALLLMANFIGIAQGLRALPGA